MGTLDEKGNGTEGIGLQCMGCSRAEMGLQRCPAVGHKRQAFLFPPHLHFSSRNEEDKEEVQLTRCHRTSAHLRWARLNPSDHAQLQGSLGTATSAG